MVPTYPGTGTTTEPDDINFRELFDILWSGKWVILLVLALAVGIALLYAMTATPIYQANGLVQVEKEQNGAKKALDDLQSLIGSDPTEAPAEIAILKSRMVLGNVVDSLKLYIAAEPRYFPVFGKAIARRRDGSTPGPSVLGLGKYAWGGEIIKVTALDVPATWYDRGFILEADGTRYRVFDGDDNPIMTGNVGERTSVMTPDGSFSIFVQELVARPGTRFSIARQSMQKSLESLSSRFNVTEQPHDSGVLNLQVQHPDSKFAARLVNEIEDAYLRQNVERRSAQAEQSLEFLKKQLPELKAKVDEAQASLNSYQLKRGTVDVKQETQLVLQRSIEIETQRLSLVQERDAALQRFTEQHPVVSSLTEQIRGLEREAGTLKKQAETLPETQQEILSLMRDLEVNTQLYTGLLNSAQELQVTKAGTVGNVRIIDYGLPPLLPIKPAKRAILSLGIIAGLILGVLTVFALRALLKGVDRPEDVERVTGLPTYASIPYSRSQSSLMSGFGARRVTKGNALLARVSADDIAIEALRSFRTSLHFAMMDAPNNIVMFTGPTPGLGKSFVSINLGAIMALSGKTAVVIDADLRRGTMHRYASIPKKPGLSDFIVGSADEKSIVRQTDIPGFSLITGGTRPPNPAEILMSPRFEGLIKSLAEKFDFVIIDTPPVLPVTDSAIIGRMCGSTFLVLKAAEHSMRVIEETIKRLRRAGIEPKGFIFNQVGAKVGSYGYGSYGETYGYSTKKYSTQAD